jgi:arsenate reductase
MYRSNRNISSVLSALRNMGFEVDKILDSKNPVYTIKYISNMHPIIGFSKTFDDFINPKPNFGAIMTCASADKGCLL